MVWPYDPVEVENIIRQGGAQYGYDPNLAMQIFKGEGFQPNTYQSRVPMGGGAEPSYGPFQLYMGGGMGNQFQQQTGLDPRDPSTVNQQAEWVAKQIPQTGWTPWNAAKNMGIGPWQGISGHAQQPQAAGAAAGEPATTGSVGGDLHAGWRDFLSNDDNRAALFQLGISLLQPIGVGQSVAGHIGQALGQAGEVYGTRDEMRQTQETADQTSLYKEQELELQRQKLAQEAPETAARTEYYKRMPKYSTGATGGLTDYQRTRIKQKISDDYSAIANDPLRLPGDPIPTWEEFRQKKLDEIGMNVDELYAPGEATTASVPPPQSEPAVSPEQAAAMKDVNTWLSATTVQQAIAAYKQLAATAGTGPASAKAEAIKQEWVEKAKKYGVNLEPYFGGTTPPPAKPVAPVASGGPLIG